MTKRIEVARAPGPLEEYMKHFDALFGKSNQREGFRRDVEGLLLPSERHKTAHVGRQYLGKLGKVDNGVVSVTSLWADEAVYYPVDFEPYPPAHHFEKGEDDPAFRTKLKIALELVNRAHTQGIPFRAVVADNFYGEDRTLRTGLRALKLGYVLALKPSHDCWHRVGTLGSLQEVAQAAGWKSAEQPGQWVKVERRFRDGSKQSWWAKARAGRSVWAREDRTGGNRHYRPGDAA